MDIRDTHRREEVQVLLTAQKKTLDYTEEDGRLLQKLWDATCKKRREISRRDAVTWTASVLWLYSRMNFLWEHDRRWSQQSLGEMLSARPQTVGNVCREMSSLLKIKNWDERFCRKDIRESNPLKGMVMLRDGSVLGREHALREGLPHIPLAMTKEDYLYDGMELVGTDDAKALKCFLKARQMDEEYVDAYNGIGSVYFDRKPSTAREYYQKAYDLTLRHFGGKLPARIEWGILENRQYLRSMHGLGLLRWREGDTAGAMELFMQMLRLNPNDNQGARYLVAALHEGVTWDGMDRYEEDRDAREALPIILSRMREDPDCFGDWLTESLPSVLYHIGEVDPLLPLLDDRRADPFARTACSRALAALAAGDRSLVARIAPAFRTILERALAGEEDDEFVSWFAGDAASLQDPGIMGLLEELWKKRMIDSTVTGRAHLRALFESGRPEEIERDTRNPMDHFRHENLERLWRVEEERAPSRQPARSRKVGRNDPCPCGSGKKYKKCCLRT